jgi:ABC-2 type transport system ATP-binding protein
VILDKSSSSTSPVVETLGLAKDYGHFGALRGLDLSVPEGSVFALLGANGAGKTTLIKTLLNILTPSRGVARVLGVDSRDIDAALLTQVGYVSENQVLPARLRVADFFDYVRDCYPTWNKALEAGLRERFSLPPDRKIGALSHGMRLKVALACAMPFRPRLLVLDEPLSGLDALARDELIDGFMHVAGETTILISSHELDEVERFATDVAFLHEGRLLFQGSRAALAEEARTLAAAGPATGRSLRDTFIAMVRAARGRPNDRALA